MLYKAQKRLMAAGTRFTASSTVVDLQPNIISKKQLQVKKQRGLCILASLRPKYCSINLDNASRDVAISPDMLPFAMHFCAELGRNIALEVVMLHEHGAY